MRRLSLKLRLTLAFTCVMAVVVGVGGVAIYEVRRAERDRSIERDVGLLLADLANLAQLETLGDAPLSGVAALRETAYQLIDGRSRVVVSSSGRAVPLLEDAELRSARSEGVEMRRAELRGMEGEWFVRAQPVGSGDGRIVAVAAESLSDRDDSLASLTRALALAGGGILLLAAAAGYGLAAHTLRRVEVMRRQAAQMWATRLKGRLSGSEAADELGRLSSTLNEMLDRTQTAVEREWTFLSNASHQLRTPVAVLKAEIELALRDADTAEELRAALESAQEECARLERLTDDLLMLARVEQTGLSPRREAVDCGELLDRVRAHALRDRRAAGREIEVNAPNGLMASVDAGQVEQAITNLVENALTHGRGTVELAAAERNGHVDFSVTDGGRGFDAAFMPRMFDRFSRSEESGVSSEGAGLGLAIVKAIADAHEGSVGAENVSGGGARVWLSVPARQRGDFTEPRDRRGSERPAPPAGGRAAGPREGPRRRR